MYLYMHAGVPMCVHTYISACMLQSEVDVKCLLLLLVALFFFVPKLEIID